MKREDDVRLGFHTQWWPLQILVWGVLVFVAFLMPNNVFSAYGQVAKVSASHRMAACLLQYPIQFLIAAGPVSAHERGVFTHADVPLDHLALLCRSAEAFS